MQQWQSRRNSQTLPAGALGQTHRVTRRKSMSAANASHLAAVAAVAVAAEGSGEPMPTSHRTMTTTTTTTTTGRRNVLARAVADQAPVDSTTDPNHIVNGAEANRSLPHRAPSDDSSWAELDRPRSKAGAGQPSPRWMPPSTARSGPKLRSRRASEGSQLRTAGGRRESGNELRCETCGKAYKHSSCLIKHLCVHMGSGAHSLDPFSFEHDDCRPC